MERWFSSEEHILLFQRKLGGSIFSSLHGYYIMCINKELFNKNVVYNKKKRNYYIVPGA